LVFVESATVERVGTLAWRAMRRGAAEGELSGWTRPDGRCQLTLRGGDADAAEALLLEARRAANGELLIVVDPADDRLASASERAGFHRKRTELEYSLDPRSAISHLGPGHLPSTLSVQDWDAIDHDRLRLLDDELRQDVPGTDGWRWTPEGFVEEITGSHFDPRFYAVLVEQPSAEYVALCRVWSRSGRPARLGMIGVVQRWRRCGVAAALLARVLAECAHRSTGAITLEIDERNVPSTTMFRSLGAVPIGSSLEMSAGPF
jgi:GNAT superfamily N-acetyltransferase